MAIGESHAFRDQLRVIVSFRHYVWRKVLSGTRGKPKKGFSRFCPWRLE
jgi:hypothetical protein